MGDPTSRPDSTRRSRIDSAHIVRTSLITMDPARPRAEAMAIDKGVVSAVGSLNDARRSVGDHAPVLDLDEMTVLPGLIDAHNHMLGTALQRRQVDVSHAECIADVIDAVRAWAAANPDAAWVRGGRGWHVDSIAERRYPTCDELDEVCSDRPVFLGNGHAAVVNSRALELSGISSDSPDPEGGTIVRDQATGRPNGLLLEFPAVELVQRQIPRGSQRERLAALRMIQDIYLSVGLTRVQEPGLASGELAAYQELWADAKLDIGITAMPLAGNGKSVTVRAQELTNLGLRTGFGDERLRLGGLKVFFDGAASLGTAYLREAWPGRAGDRGKLVTSPDDLYEVARLCATRGWSLGIHVVGGGGIDEALAVFKRIDRQIPIKGKRFTLIHAYLWPSAQNMVDAAKLGLLVATQPTMQERFASILRETFGDDPAARTTPLRSWLRAGVTVAGGSDSPVTPFEPLRGIWQAVTRHHEDLGGPLGADECISVQEALEMYTRNAALASHAERDGGAMCVGHRADWIALPVDPLRCSPGELRDMPVLLTAIDGRIVHDAR